MKRLLVLIATLALTLGAQEAQTRKWLQKVIDVKYADVQALANLIASGVRDARIQPNRELRAISIGTYNDFDMQMAEEIIKRYDVARGAAPTGNRNIELVVYMLLASPKGNAGEAVPADLEPVTKQLKSLFGYSDFRLLDSALIRTREGVQVGSNGTAGIIDPDLPNASAPYQLSIRSANLIPSDRGSAIRLDGFRFGIRVPYPTAPGGGHSFSEVGISTELDVREGQKVVIGKAKVANSNSALVLVVTAKAID